MGIVVEPAGVGQRRAQRVLAGMAERRMAEVVGEAQGLGQILVEPERPGDRAADLRDFDAVRQPDPEMIAVGRDEHLGLVAQAAEGDRMDDPVAVALEDVAGPARTRIGFGMKAAARPGRSAASAAGSVIRSRAGRSCRLSELVHLNAFNSTDPRSSANISASAALRNGPITRRARSGLRAT